MTNTERSVKNVNIQLCPSVSSDSQNENKQLNAMDALKIPRENIFIDTDGNAVIWEANYFTPKEPWKTWRSRQVFPVSIISGY